MEERGAMSGSPRWRALGAIAQWTPADDGTGWSSRRCPMKIALVADAIDRKKMRCDP
jgi:hypothetical protein